ncbi:MAG: SIMPL domain-containing protein [Acidimicrobiia bacterium]|nr:SIMPL domain-containing protein [Acidimicrobiia bacterium]
MTARSDRHGILVLGTGVVSTPPDVMHLVLGVSVRRDSVAAARADAARLTRTIITALKDTGVDDRDLQTARFGVHPEYRHTERRRLLDGYRVTSTVRVTVRDLDRAGDVVDAAIAAGGNDVVLDHVAFAIEDDTAARSSARALAWKDALAKAEELAGSAGLTLGDAEWIAEQAGGVGPEPMARLAAAEATTPIESGATDVVVVLEVRFAIAP